MVFDWIAGKKDYDDVLTTLFLPLDPNNGSLIVGMHEIAFDNGGSESFVHAVPRIHAVSVRGVICPGAMCPGAMWLFVGALGFIRVKRLRSSSQATV